MESNQFNYPAGAPAVGKVLAGGERHALGGTYYSPTVLADGRLAITVKAIAGGAVTGTRPRS